jgi:cysteine desulfurase family protein (TIGR01976 family)
MPIKPEQVRKDFPALQREVIFFDNPGGTQVPGRVIDRMVSYLRETNANHGGAFETSQRSDEIIADARRAMAAFLNASSPDEIIFGPNMTSLTFNLSRSLARELNPGDEIIVTRLDHDANISPWLKAAEERDAVIRWLDFDVEDCTLQLEQLDQLLSDRTRLVAVGYASNAVGTINPVEDIIQRARAFGALTYIDAVQYAPHGPIDVQGLDCDFLVVSAYKFFGPHLGALYGRHELLERLDAYRVRPAPSEPPGKFETGTQNHEGIAGTLGALEYLAELGDSLPPLSDSRREQIGTKLNADLHRAMHAIQAYETRLSEKLLDTLSELPGLRIWGLQSSETIEKRVPTVSFTMQGHDPRSIASYLGDHGIYTWDGNYYALAVTERLGLEDQGGMLRVGLAHYNTIEEIDRLGEALSALAER